MSSIFKSIVGTLIVMIQSSSMHLSPNNKRWNSGVLVVDLDYLARPDITEDTLETLEKMQYRMVSLTGSCSILAHCSLIVRVRRRHISLVP